MHEFKIISLISILIALTYSKVTFKLITPKGKPSVVVNNISYELKENEFPVFTADVDVNTPVTYYYTIDYSSTNEANLGVVKESFDRKLESGSSTLNEFFNRPITVKKHPNLPRAYKAYEYSNLSKLYDDTHISTIIIKADKNEINKLHQNPTDENLKLTGITVIYTSPFSVRSFNNATLSVSGQSTIYAKKLSYKISNLKTQKNKELYKRSGIKLRAQHMDSSYLREKMYIDVVNSVGAPTTQSKFTRLFINDDAIGLFLIVDNMSNKRFLRETLNNGNKYELENHPFKVDYFPPTAWGDLGYYGEANEMYSVYYYKGDDVVDSDTMIDNKMLKVHLIPFLKQISEYPTTKTLKMDIQMFLKYMAVEYSCGAIENYWFRPGNFYLYKNVNYGGGYWYFMDTDFHYSFGIGGDETSKMLESTIDTYSQANPEVDPKRPLLDNIRSVPENEKFLKEAFARLLQTSVNTKAIFPRIDSFAELIKDDVEWDLKLPRVSGYNESIDLNYTLDDFIYHTQSLEGEGLTDEFPLKYWIKTKGEKLAKELGMEYPTTVDYSLGEVEPLYQTSDAIIRIHTTSWQILIISLLIIVMSYQLL